MNNLSAAFADMRREGLLAKQNFSCCLSCAGYELTALAVKLVKAKKPFKGVAFYHAQDAERKRASKDFHLGFGDVESTAMGKLGLPTKQVGEIVVRCLKARGIGYEWSGDPKERILIKTDSIRELSKPKEPKGVEPENGNGNSAKKQKPEVQLVGQDGNIFAILGRCRRALRKAGQEKEAEEMMERAAKAGSYHEALGIVQEYVDAS